MENTTIYPDSSEERKKSISKPTLIERFFTIDNRDEIYTLEEPDETEKSGSSSSEKASYLGTPFLSS